MAFETFYAILIATFANCGRSEPLRRLGGALPARRTRALEPVEVVRRLPTEELGGVREQRSQASAIDNGPPRTAATASALRRITHRRASAGGGSATVRRRPNGPITDFSPSGIARALPQAKHGRACPHRHLP